MMSYYKIALTIGIFSFVYTYILTRPHMILNGVYNWINDVFKTDERAAQGKSPHWIFMVVMYCEKCNAGQLALWIFLYHFSIPYYFEYGALATFGCLCGFTTTAILTAAALKGFYIKYIET